MTGSAWLARSVLVLAETPPPLAPPGALQRWVLEQPLPLAIALVLAGAIAYFVLQRQGKAKESTRAAGALILVGLVVFGVGTAIETRGEKLKARARELVAAVAAADPMRVGPFLADDVIAMPFAFNRDTIMRRLESDLGRAYPIKSHTIQTIRAKIDGPNIARTQLRVVVVTEGTLYAAPIGSWWMLTWRLDPATSQWKLIELEMQALDGMDVSSLRP